jgi:hypothetical protein
VSVFRQQYRALTVEEQNWVMTVKQQADWLYAMLHQPVIDDRRRDNRELQLAKTKLEECVMWATKAVTG